VVVSPTSGTTRDLVGATTVLDGWTFRFVDAAGLRDAADPIERAGTRLTVEAAERADVALRIFDATVDRVVQEAVFERFFGDRAATLAERTLDVLNKIDLPSDRLAASWGDWRNGRENDGEESWTICPISAKTGAGVDALTKRLVAATVGDAARTVGPLPWSVEQVAFLRELSDACARGDFDAAANALEE
ncbi:MAG: 50S ribosome-binding GTPase, partial [Thermoguttaceae bacterium]|nr:50S ribosome-binding GTPase [Thermoguttaceae bacterium]